MKNIVYFILLITILTSLYLEFVYKPNKFKEHFNIKNKIDSKTKLFLYRDDTKRISRDQDILKEFLIDKGYQVFNPSKMSFEDQVRICSKASSFIGFSGAGFTNSLFLPKKSRKIILANSSYKTLLTIWDYLLENTNFIENDNDYEFGIDDCHGNPYLTKENWKQIKDLI